MEARRCAGKQEFEFRVDESGRIVRLIPNSAMAARKVLAKQTGANPSRIRFAQIEKVEWPDACLGVRAADQICAQVITPGYKVQLQLENTLYEFHTDLHGEQIVPAQTPEAQVESAKVVWTQENDGKCEFVSITADGVEFGECKGEKQSLDLISPVRMADLAEFATRFASFTAETATGRIDFSGQGDVTATPSQQRMLAEMGAPGI